MYAWPQNSREHQARETAVIDFQAAGESHHVHREGEQKKSFAWNMGYGVWWMAEEPQNCQRTYWYEYVHWYSGFHQFPDLPPQRLSQTISRFYSPCFVGLQVRLGDRLVDFVRSYSWHLVPNGRGLTSHHRRRIVPWNAWCCRTLDGFFGKSWRECHLAAVLRVVWLYDDCMMWYFDAFGRIWCMYVGCGGCDPVISQSCRHPSSATVQVILTSQGSSEHSISAGNPRSTKRNQDSLSGLEIHGNSSSELVKFHQLWQFEIPWNAAFRVPFLASCLSPGGSVQHWWPVGPECGGRCFPAGNRQVRKWLGGWRLYIKWRLSHAVLPCSVLISQGQKNEQR